MNTTITNAVDEVNAENRRIAEGKAAVIIGKISSVRERIYEINKEIATLQSSLVELQAPEITFEIVTGYSLPSEASQNENQKTIAKVVGEIVKGKQGNVADKANRIVEAVLSHQASLVELEKLVNGYLGELANVSPVVVTESEITSA